MDDNLGDFFGLQESFRVIGTPLENVQLLLHRSGGASREYAQNTNTIAVDFLPEAVGDGFQGVLARSVLRDVGTSVQSGGRIHENDLTSAKLEQRQQGLGQKIRAAKIRLIVLI